jgi:hypothetical protein
MSRLLQGVNNESISVVLLFVPSLLHHRPGFVRGFSVDACPRPKSNDKRIVDRSTNVF